MSESSNKPTKCWFCAKLGKCQVLKPCKDFVRYNYHAKGKKKVKAPKPKIYSQEEVSVLLGVSRPSLTHWLKNEPEMVLSRLHKITGKHFKYEVTQGKQRKRIQQIDE